MPAWVAGLYPLLQVSAGLAVTMVLLPLVVLPPRPEDDGLLRFWRALLWGVLFWTATVYLLEVLRGLELLTLLAAAILGLVGARWLLRPRPASSEPQDRPGLVLVGRLLELLDAEWRATRRRARAEIRAARGRRVRATLHRLTRPVPLLTLLTLLGAWGLRLFPTLQRATPTTSDGFVHLLWTNFLLLNHLFPQGVYPRGMHAVAAVIADTFFLDPLTVLRFLGPLAGGLMVLGVYTLARDTGGGDLGALLAVAVFGLMTASPLPEAAGRQMSPLPQEFAAMFLPVGVVWTLRYLEGRDAGAVWLIGQVALVGALVHPYTPAFLCLSVACLGLGWSLVEPASRTRAVRAMGAAVGGTLLGLVPLGVARALGIPFFVIGYVLRPNSSPSLSHIWTVLGTNPFLAATVLLGLGAVVWALARGGGPLRPRTLGLGLLLLGLVVVLAMGTAAVPLIPAPSRTEEFLSLLLVPLGAGLLLGGPLARPEHRRGAVLLATLIVVPELVLWPPRPPQRVANMDIQGAASAYLRIRNQFAPYQWTIVSPVQQYSEALARGWHEELLDFVRRFSLADAANPHFSLENAHPGAIATPNVFIFVEMVPLGSTAPLSAADLALPLPTVDRASDYLGTDLAAIEARAAEWCLTYLRSHPEQATIYVHRGPREVFWIRQQ